mgnify:CR=1 FL=1
MSNRTWACIDCRQKYRRDQNSKNAVKCALCGKVCEQVGWKIRVPSPKKDKKWVKFWNTYFQEKELLVKYKNRELHESVYLQMHNMTLNPTCKKNT